MAKIITFAVQKGGVSKTTTTGITAALLAKEGHRVLVCDMDSQGNATQLLTRRSIYNFEATIFEALQDGDARQYIEDTTIEGVKILPANDVLISLAKWLYTEEEGRVRNPATLLKEALSHVQDDFDYILVDTPPNLGEAVQTALVASDGVVVLFEPSEWCLDAVKRFIRFAGMMSQNTEHTIKLVGILRNLTDVRRTDVREFNEMVTELYPDLMFETIIKRSAPAGRIGLYGLSDNPELRDALEPYKAFVEELKKRI